MQKRVRNFHAFVMDSNIFFRCFQRTFIAFETVPYWKKKMPRLRSHVNLCLLAEEGIKETCSMVGVSSLKPSSSVCKFYGIRFLLNIRKVFSRGLTDT